MVAVNDGGDGGGHHRGNGHLRIKNTKKSERQEYISNMASRSIFSEDVLRDLKFPKSFRLEMASMGKDARAFGYISLLFSFAGMISHEGWGHVVGMIQDSERSGDPPRYHDKIFVRSCMAEDFVHILKSLPSNIYLDKIKDLVLQPTVRHHESRVKTLNAVSGFVSRHPFQIAEPPLCAMLPNRSRTVSWNTWT